MLVPKFPNLPQVALNSARIKLTIWYLFIVMAVSIIFSFAIYSGINSELEHFEKLTVVKQEVDFFGTRIVRSPAFDIDTIKESRQKLVLTLVVINISILLVSGISGYLLAGKTLKPVEEILEDQKRFIADASHELRTPLTVMKTELEVALRDKNMTLPEAKKLLQSNLEETNKMQSLSNYLLSLSRYQNSQTIQEDKFSLTELLNEVVVSLAPTAKKRGIKVKTDFKEVGVEGNRDSIRELFTILIDNAIKYSHDKGEVLVRAKNKDRRAVVEVEDKGIGIKPDDLPHIFDRFYRSDSSRAKSGAEGYGLGLSIAKSIVDLHDGKIEVKSRPGSGTTFTVTI